jgi:hypothetical protein
MIIRPYFGECDECNFRPYFGECDECNFRPYFNEKRELLFATRSKSVTDDSEAVKKS